MTTFSKSVRLIMTKEQRLTYKTPPGINFILYPPNPPDSDEVVASFSCSNINPNPQQRKTLEDIDRELAESDRKKFKIINDSVSTAEQPNLIQNPKLKHETILDGPGLDNENDYLRSKAINKKVVTVNSETMQEINKHFESFKTLYSRHKINAIKEEKKGSETFYDIEIGELVH